MIDLDQRLILSLEVQFYQKYDLQRWTDSTSYGDG